MGELGFVTRNNKRTQTVECIENGEVLTITYDRLLEIYFDNPEFGYFFLRLASDRLLQNIARLEATIAAAAGATAPARPVDSQDPDDKSEVTTATQMIGSVEPGKDASILVGEMTSPDAIETQIQMLRRISQIYSVPFSTNRGKALIASLAGSMIPASSGMGAASLTKSVPVVGTAVSAIVMPALSAGATYAIGMAFIQHFASGGTLLDFNPREYREFFKAQKDLWSTRSRAARAAAKGTFAAERKPSQRSDSRFLGSLPNWRKYLRLPH